jgi:Tol biopolymer transport system component
MDNLGIHAEAAREALDRALQSPEFRLSGRMSQLLRFLVEATLADRAAELKETVVGAEVFGRPPDYDPKIDPVVRKEARRLRLKLQEYYQGSGAAETSRIDLPKGGYVPVFVVLDPARPAEPESPHPTSSNPPTNLPLTRKRLPWGLPAGVVLLLLMGSLAILRTHVLDNVSVPQPLTGNSGSERSPAFSPDGQQLAYAWDAEPDADPAIYIETAHSPTPRRLTTSTAYENHPAWSPDAKELAFVRRTPRGAYAVVIRQLDTGAERTLTEISAPDHLDWSPDATTIATSDAVPGSPSSIILISAQTGGRRQITVPAPGLGDTYPRFSPDGERLAFLRAVAVDEAELFLLDWKSRQPPKQLTFENRKVEGFTWAPGGRSFILSLARGATARSLWRLPVDGGPMERIAAAGTAAYTPVWSARRGALAYVQRRDNINLWRIPTGEGAAGQIAATQATTAAPTPALVASSSHLDSCPAFSPDGTELAYRSDRSGTNEIWLTALLHNTPRRLTYINGPLTGRPRWSPDGKSIAFDSRVSGNSDVLIAAVTGGGWHNLTNTPSNEVIPSWSHDSQWIYFGSDRGGRWQIWKQPASGGPAEQVTWRGGYAAAESPDGKYLYYTRSPDSPGLYRIPLTGGEEEPILPTFAGMLWGNWAIAPHGIYYLHYPDQNPSTTSTIRYLDLTTTQSHDIYRLPKHPVLWDGGLALSPDAKWLVFAELDYSGSNVQMLDGFK